MMTGYGYSDMPYFAQRPCCNKSNQDVPYLLEYKSHSCISRTLTFELKIGTKFF